MVQGPVLEGDSGLGVRVYELPVQRERLSPALIGVRGGIKRERPVSSVIGFRYFPKMVTLGVRSCVIATHE